MSRRYRGGRAHRWADRKREFRQREGQVRRHAYVAADACRTCDGLGTIRTRTDRRPCPDCGGSGQQVPGPGPLLR